MKLATIATCAGLVATVVAIGTAIGFTKPWPDKDQISRLNAVVVENRALISSNRDILALITYDRLLRKLRQEGKLDHRDLIAFCIAASHLKIRHSACR